LIYID